LVAYRFLSVIGGSRNIDRSNIEEISQILKVANGGNATKTRIRYKALLGYNQLKEHLVLLTEMDLLRYNGNTGTFNTTDKGLRFLQIYNEIEDMIK
jgi:predicted transcriptional regulator